PHDPYASVRKLYEQIALGKKRDEDTNMVCGSFNAAAQQEFADNLNYRNCEEAARNLPNRVRDISTYAVPKFDRPSKSIKEDTIEIEACQIHVAGGPPLGTFELKKVNKGQWIITGHENGPEQCPDSSGTSTAPTR